MNTSTSSKPPTNTISKKLEKQHEKIRIGFVPTKITCFSTKKAHYSLYWVMTVLLVLFSLGGFIFGAYNWMSSLSNIDGSMAAKLSPSFDQVTSKQRKNVGVRTTPPAYENELDKSYPEQQLSPGTDLFPNRTENNKDDSPKFIFSTDLTTSDTKYEQGSEPSKRATMDFTTIDIDNDGICEEFVFSTKVNFSKTSHSIGIVHFLGIYDLQNFYRYNGKVVYYNKKIDAYLYYHTYNKSIVENRFGYENHAHPDVGGIWVIGRFFDGFAEKYISLRAYAKAFQKFVLAYNPLCADTEYPANGECEVGWHFLNELGFYKGGSTEYVMCRKPKPVTRNVPANSICTQFELSSSKEFGTNYFGEYQMMNTSYNDKVVYQKLEPIDNNSVFMYFVIDDMDDDLSAWVIGPVIGSQMVLAINEYCSDVDYPANGNCNSGWFQYSGKSQNEFPWHFDSSMTLECKVYHQ